MKQELVEIWRTNKKKGLTEIRRRIMGALKDPKNIEIYPDGYLIGNTHGIRFKINNEKFFISGEVRCDSKF